MSPGFEEFQATPPPVDDPNQVICVQCRLRVRKTETKFVAVERGYLCTGCQRHRRRLLLIKVATVAIGVVLVILGILRRVGGF